MKLLPLSSLLMIAALCWLLTGCSAKSIEGWVVDEESATPVEGVVVVAHWQKKGGLEGGNPAGQAMVMEAVTDKNGRFFFPAWGPKLVLKGDIKAERPELLLLKTGYKPLALSNAVRSDYGMNPVMKSDWNGKTIKLRKGDADLKTRIEEFDLFDIDLDVFVRNGLACEWKKIPNMLREVRKQRLALLALGTVPDAWQLHGVDQDLLGNPAYYARRGNEICGSPKNIFK